MTLVKKILKNISTIGSLNTARWFIIRTLKKMINFDVIIIMERELSNPIDRKNPKINVVNRLIDSGGLEEITGDKYEFMREDRFTDADSIYHEMEKRLMGNQITCISTVNNKIVAWKWLDFERISIPELGLEIKLPAKYVNFFDVYTVPSYRGMHIQPAASEYLFHILQEKGITRCISYVSFDNIPSMAAQKSSGWKKKGYIYFIALKERKFFFPKQLFNNSHFREALYKK